MALAKFNKLYFPGLISLAVLPVICISYLLNNNTFHKYRVMDVAWITKAELNRLVTRDQPGLKFDIETFRKYKILQITGDLKNDSLKLELLKGLLARLLILNDTINGVKISFGNKSQYGELVSVLDICYQNAPFTIDPIGNDIFISHVATPKVDKYVHCAGILEDDIIVYPPEISYFSRFKTKAFYIKIYADAINFWPSACIFTLMIYFAICKRQRYLHLRNLT